MFIDPNPDFEIGEAVGRELERQRLAAYVYEHLAPGIMHSD